MNTPRPPKWAIRFLQWFCREDLRDAVLGDLQELYARRYRVLGKKRADWLFAWSVFMFLRPFAFKKRQKSFSSNHFTMFQHYFKVSWRNLLRQKLYSMINLSGLAVGMAVAMFIGLWIQDEFSYNTNHQNHDRIAQVMQHQTFNGDKRTERSIPIPLGDELKNTYGSDFEYLVLASWMSDHVLTYEDNSVMKTGNYMDVDAPRLLSLNMLEGTFDGLKESGSILLSASTAQALFGDDDPMGKQVRIDNTLSVVVTGVYEDIPFNSRFYNLLFIAPWELYVSSYKWVQNNRDQNNWSNNAFQLFAQIAEHADMEQLSTKIKWIKYDQLPEDERVSKAEIFLHPMSDWRLRSNWENGVQKAGYIQYIWMFGIVGIFVLILACINFMNLSTARSEKRAKEVGIRKSIGSRRGQLAYQFLSESFLVVILAFVLSVLLVLLFIPYFNELANKHIQFTFSSPTFWMSSLGFILVTGFLAGSYPALYLSSFHPVQVLKGTFKAGRSTLISRKVLVTLQFSISVILIIGTMVVHQQLIHTKNRPIGYDQSSIVMIQMTSDDFYGKYDLLRSELKSRDAILEMSESSSPLTGVWSNSGGFDWEGKDPALQAEFATIQVTHDFGKTIGWEIIEGRDFSRDFTTDTVGMVINETAVKFMGIEDPIGKTVRWGDEKNRQDYKIIGIVKDVLMESPFSPVKQTVYLMSYENVNWINLKLNPQKSTAESIALIQHVFDEFLPSVPLDYTFADQEHAQKFESEERVGILSGIFATLATFISCLGLFGLASFMAEQRTKEIGIRKVLGASVFDLWQLLSKDFVTLVILSFFIAIPIAYYMLTGWLQNFEYRTDLHWWIFVSAGVGALMITLLTVSFQAIKAATANPVNSLRAE